jgi:phosphatidylinositol glycan class B
LSFVLALAYFHVSFKKFWNPLLLSANFYLFVHLLISNKELRFLFPLLPAVVPALFLLPWVQAFILSRRWGWVVLRRFLVAENMILLAGVTLLPSTSSVLMFNAIYRHSESVRTLYSVGSPPYTALGSDIHFYRRPELAYLGLGSWQEAEKVLAMEKGGILLFIHTLEMPPDAQSLKSRCQLIYSTLPAWVTKVNFNQWLSRTRSWSLYRCQESQ